MSNFRYIINYHFNFNLLLLSLTISLSCCSVSKAKAHFNFVHQFRSFPSSEIENIHQLLSINQIIFHKFMIRWSLFSWNLPLKNLIHSFLTFFWFFILSFKFKYHFYEHLEIKTWKTEYGDCLWTVEDHLNLPMLYFNEIFGIFIWIFWLTVGLNILVWWWR